MRRSRSAMTRIICNAKLGVCCARNLKRFSLISTSLQAVFGGFCNSAGATRHFVEQGHRAQNTAGAEAFNEPAFDQQINFAFNHDVNGNAAGITFAEYDLACRNGGVSAWLRNISIVTHWLPRALDVT